MTRSNFNRIIENLEDTKEAYERIEFLIGLSELDGSKEISQILEKINISFKLNIEELKNLNTPNKKLEIIK